jgi:hypothetical protein
VKTESEGECDIVYVRIVRMNLHWSRRANQNDQSSVFHVSSSRGRFFALLNSAIHCTRHWIDLLYRLLHCDTSTLPPSLTHPPSPAHTASLHSLWPPDEAQRAWLFATFLQTRRCRGQSPRMQPSRPPEITRDTISRVGKACLF